MKKIIFAASLLITAGCEIGLQSEITPEFGQPQLVVNAVLDTDSVFQAKVTINKPILEDVPFENVENATVTLSDEFGYSEILHHKKDGLYVSSGKKPEAGKTYSISVAAPGFETAHATSSIPHPAPITYLKFGNPVIIDGLQKETFDITLSFHDTPNEENFYEIMVAYGDYYYDSLLQENISFFADAGVSQKGIEDDLTVIGSRLFLKDTFIEGKEATLALSAETIAWFGSLSAVVVRTVSKQYFDYMVTSQLHHDVKNNPFAQPVNVANNIENGFGIFAGHSNSKQIIERKFPTITSFSPTEGRPGDLVTIIGENFIPGATLVSFSSNGTNPAGNNYAEIEEMSTNHVKVVVPDDAATGYIMVQAVGRGAFSSTMFTLLN